MDFKKLPLDRMFATVLCVGGATQRLQGNGEINVNAVPKDGFRTEK